MKIFDPRYPTEVTLPPYAEQNTVHISTCNAQNDLESRIYAHVHVALKSR